MRLRPPEPGVDGPLSRHVSRPNEFGRWKWPLVASSVLVLLVVVSGWLDINFLQRTKLLTAIPSSLMPLVWGMRLAGALLSVANILIVLRLGAAGHLRSVAIMLALIAAPATMFVMNSFAGRIADAALFHGGVERTIEVDCPVSNFGGRSGNYYVLVDCDGTGRVSIEVLASYFDALTAVRRKRAPGADLNVCLRLTVQTSGQNERLIIPSMFDANLPLLSNCKSSQP